MYTMKTVVYPGTFDPVTNGHIDIIERAVKLSDKLYVLVGDNPQKAPTFTPDERVEMLKETLKKHNDKIEVEYFEGLLLDYVKKKKSNIIIRGLRAGFDFEMEFEMALMWRNLAHDIDVVCMMSALEYQFIYSSRIKEVAGLGGYIDNLVPPDVATLLNERISNPTE